MATDKTFTDGDIIRIFEKHLDSEERIEVLRYFKAVINEVPFEFVDTKDFKREVKTYVDNTEGIIQELFEALSAFVLSPGIGTGWIVIKAISDGLLSILDAQKQLKQKMEA